MDPFRAPEKNQNSLNPRGQQEKDAAKRETQKVGQTQPATGAQRSSSWSMWPVMCHFLIAHTHTHTFYTMCMCVWLNPVFALCSAGVLVQVTTGPVRPKTGRDVEYVDNQMCFQKSHLKRREIVFLLHSGGSCEFYLNPVFYFQSEGTLKNLYRCWCGKQSARVHRFNRCRIKRYQSKLDDCTCRLLKTI